MLAYVARIWLERISTDKLFSENHKTDAIRNTVNAHFKTKTRVRDGN